MAPFVWATKDAYSKNEEKVLKGKLIEKLALEELEKPGGPASRGATQVIWWGLSLLFRRRTLKFETLAKLH